jgi:hypothetical protein
MKITVLGAISVIAVVGIVIAVAMAMKNSNQPDQNSDCPDEFPSF